MDSMAWSLVARRAGLIRSIEHIASRPGTSVLVRAIYFLLNGMVFCLLAGAVRAATHQHINCEIRFVLGDSGAPPSITTRPQPNAATVPRH